MAKGVKGGRTGASAATAKRGWGRAAVKGLVALSVFMVFSGLIVYAYNQGKEAGGGNRPPIVKAGPAPYKVRPDRPGGMQVLNRDKQIYSQFDGKPKSPVVERLLPPAETPMAPTAAPPAAPAAPASEPSPPIDADPVKALELKPKIVDQLVTVFDPEIPVNIYELGLIYDIAVDAAGLAVIQMTLTAPGCPAAVTLPAEVQGKVKSVAGVSDARVDLVWEPPWDKDRMTDAAKLQLGIFD